jgi:hypothetical protein
MKKTNFYALFFYINLLITKAASTIFLWTVI